ncbi:MAG: tRNA pseudouridine synthase 1 [Geoglossum simile]|nr:MAG: tRNA pseudouridine synthase 1 [Geoglossum simile]
MEWRQWEERGKETRVEQNGGVDIPPIESIPITNNGLSREYQDKRSRGGSQSNSRDPGLAFSKEETTHEERKPKRKVVVMIGYSGSGYKGMQLNVKEKTIEGDLFAAFVATGAISKVNSDDPTKSSLSRCARTDKGVHAAGNVISLKLIIEDPDIVRRINENLPPQIRVWGIERTNNSFNCYHLCDSRVYEYLIPTYCFLPPHPRSLLGKLVLKDAELGDIEGYNSRQEEVLDFWPNVERDQVEPIISQLDSETRASVLQPTDKRDRQAASADGERPPQNPALRSVKTAYLNAKRSYRIDTRRLQRVRDALILYNGVHNYHNYTIGKSARDPSAKRNIKSFTISENSPFVANGIEWLSLQVHGQSFMMHQIRKMVAMAALCVRTGCPLERINESYGLADISIPKAPGTGLLLVQPVFDNYNMRAVKDFQREKIDFGKFEEEVREFKQREIYDRIYREEENDHGFDAFLTNIDNFSKDSFNYLTSTGITNTAKPSRLDGNKTRCIERVETQIDSEEEDESAGKSRLALEEG